MSGPLGLQTYIPTITSVVAIAISSLTLGWTIYRDAIRKPKFRVDVAVKKIIQAGHPEDGPYVFVEALNLGPIANRIGLTFLSITLPLSLSLSASRVIDRTPFFLDRLDKNNACRFRTARREIKLRLAGRAVEGDIAEWRACRDWAAEDIRRDRAGFKLGDSHFIGRGMLQ